MHSSQPEPTPSLQRYSWLGREDLVRERLIETRQAAGREPAVHCAGELDAAAGEELAAALMGLSDAEIDLLVLDLSEVRFLDGYVLGVIAATHLRLARRGVGMRVLANGQPRKMFEISGLADGIEMAAEGPEARAA